MRALVLLLLFGCGDSREAPAPQPRSAQIAKVAPRVSAPALPAASVELAADLRDADPRVRAAAVREAAHDGGDAQIFVAATRDPDLHVAFAGAEALGKLHAKGEVAATELVAIVRDRALNERVRVSALNGLGLVASAEAASTLTALLANGDVTERRSAAILLLHQDPGAAVPALIDALGDADAVVRTNALEALRARARGRDFGSDAGAWRAWWQARSR